MNDSKAPSRKKINLEIERRKTRKRRMSQSIIALIFLALFAAIGWIAWDVQTRNWILRFEGTRIATSDLQFYSTIFSSPERSDDENLDSALDQLLETLVILDQAERRGLGFTSAELNDLREDIPMILQWNGIPENIVSDRRAAELLNSGILLERLLDIYVPDVPPTPEEFAEGLEAYIINNRNFYDDVQVKHAVVPAEQVDAILETVGTPQFDEYVATHAFLPNADPEILTVTALDLANNIMGELADFMDYFIIVGMEHGDTEVLQLSDGSSLIVHVYSRTPGDREVMEANFTRTADNERLDEREESFDPTFRSWVEDATSRVTINERAMNSFR